MASPVSSNDSDEAWSNAILRGAHADQDLPSRPAKPGSFGRIYDRTGSADSAGDTSPREPWTLHEHPLIRAALHILARANRTGFQTVPKRMVIGGIGRGDPDAYREALHGEPERRIDEPLDQILADEPPSSFLRFALQDLDLARERLKTRNRIA